MAPLAGHPLSSIPGESRPALPQPAAARAVTVVYRQAELILLCALVGIAASVLVSMRQADTPVAQRVAPAGPDGTRLAQARHELSDAQDRIVALLAPDVAPASAAADGTSLKLDPSPGSGAGRAVAGAQAPQAFEPQLQLRLDEPPPPRGDGVETLLDLDPPPAIGPQRPAVRVRENTPLGAELGRLERLRGQARARYQDLRARLDQIDVYLHLNPPAAGRERVDASGAERQVRVVRQLGPLAGLLLGLALALRRELGGDRLRSPREVEWALGVPVLGGLPTLSARARAACFPERGAA